MKKSGKFTTNYSTVLRQNSLIVIIWLAILAGVSRSQTPSNENVIISSVSAAAARELAGDSTSKIRIVSEEQGLSRLFASGLAEALRTKYSKVTLSPAADSTSQNLYFNILGFSFDFKKGASRGLFRARKIKRELESQLRISIRGGLDGMLLDARNLSVNYSDEIEPSMINLVNSREIPELAPDAPGSGWSRFLEPSLVIGSVGALVYLFFANR
jgi:hypothetical protein